MGRVETILLTSVSWDGVGLGPEIWIDDAPFLLFLKNRWTLNEYLLYFLPFVLSLSNTETRGTAGVRRGKSPVDESLSETI